MSDESQFLFVTCQVGAEAAAKNELKRDWPATRPAYSRPGFLTFKSPADFRPDAQFELQGVFARAWGFTLGRLTGETTLELAKGARDLVGKRRFGALHVWQRDTMPVGYRAFEPGPTPLSDEAGQALDMAVAASGQPWWFNASGPVLDCIVVEPREWWLGFHYIHSIPSRWPGGIFVAGEPSTDPVSRAYLKMCEAVAWSQLPVRRGDTIAEIGSSPGGSSQALLARGLKVIGIDPAEMDDRVLAHQRFKHIQKRGHEVRRREFRDVRWLAVDINLAPEYTLKTVEGIVTNSNVQIEGLLLTLKLLDWKLADEIPSYLDRIRSWGYSHIAARQLSHNRREICVAAQRALEKPRRAR